VARLLVVDDDQKIRSHLATYLRSLGHAVEPAADGVEALRIAGSEPVEIVLSDLRMAGMDGMALLRELRRRRPDAAVILMTAYATVPGAVEAMREGAFHYLVKPFALEEVRLLVERACELVVLRRDNRALRSGLEAPALLESQNAATRRAVETARQAADSDVNVLLLGESGTGKNVLARAIHAWSPRRAGPFVIISCTTLAEHLLESELFGHVKGAFTGAWKDKPGRLDSAAGGTLFLDEVGELATPLQVKLLRVLQEEEVRPLGETKPRAVDVRVIAATARQLDAEVAAGRFREDLFYRLNVVRLEVPPLRERPRDVPLLVDHFVAQLRGTLGKPVRSVSDDALERLVAYRWPGNVRELENVIERAVILATSETIGLAELPQNVISADEPDGPNSDLSLKRARRAAEVGAIRRALRATGGNRTHAARLLRISHRALLYKLKEYAIRN
jgi:two-component system response regulator AtoC